MHGGPGRPRHPGRPEAPGEGLAGWVCPEALREAARRLPEEPGVYVFMGEGALPLYIGKSVNLRARVLSHLRNPDEVRWLRQARRIDHVPTAGEIGALLLEAQLVKARHPLMNQRLRGNRQLCALRWQAGRPVVVHACEVDFARTPHLHGPFGSPRAAQGFLRELADVHRLCLGALGLEKLAKGRGCFRSALGQCAGVCRGDESLHDHDARLQAGLEARRLRCWPHPGAVALVERRAGVTDHLVIDHWRYLGRAEGPAQARALALASASTLASAPGSAMDFDADGYRILCGPVWQDGAEIVCLTEGGASI